MNIQASLNNGFKFLVDNYNNYNDGGINLPENDELQLQLSDYQNAILRPTDKLEERILTGIPTLDKMFGEWEDIRKNGKESREFMAGLNKQDILLIGGMSGIGKTTLAFNLFVNLHKLQQNPIFFSLDMRIKRAWQGLRKSMIGYHGTSEDFINELAKWGSIPKMVTIQETIPVSAIDNFLDKNPTTAIFIDYITKLTPSRPFKDDKEKFILLFKELKKLAEKYNCAIFMLSQTMEDKYYNQGRPTLANLYGGVDVRSEVDHVIAVYRNSKYNERLPKEFKTVTEIIGLKTRSDEGSVDRCHVKFSEGKLIELSDQERVSYKFAMTSK